MSNPIEMGISLHTQTRRQRERIVQSHNKFSSKSLKENINIPFPYYLHLLHVSGVLQMLTVWCASKEFS